MPMFRNIAEEVRWLPELREIHILAWIRAPRLEQQQERSLEAMSHWHDPEERLRDASLPVPCAHADGSAQGTNEPNQLYLHRLGDPGLDERVRLDPGKGFDASKSAPCAPYVD